MRSTTPPSLGRAVLTGAVLGVVASLAMAMFAMLAAYTKDTGFFTPLYHIGSLVTADADMMTSMQAAQMEGEAFTFLAGPALVGAMIHMMTGAMYGAVFGALASRLRLGLAAMAGVGVVYGFVVFVLSAFAGLPLAAALFDSGDPIANMAEMAGWGVFVSEHLLFGGVLGALYAATGRRAASTVATEPSHAHAG